MTLWVRDRPVSPPPPLDLRDPRPFHRTWPGYEPTPLRRLDDLARELGVGSVFLKDESSRLDLPAFKILGASWAVACLLEREFGVGIDGWSDVDALRASLPAGLTFVTATDGNHGRALAHVARRVGARARVFLPAGTEDFVTDAIAGEGAITTVLAGSYDEAVEHAREFAHRDPRCWLVQDTAGESHDDIPAWITEGYRTLFLELDEQHEDPFDLVILPVGVGSFAAAAAVHFDPIRTALVAVEPHRADGLHRSLHAGIPVEAPAPHHSMLRGLNCGRVSTLAWPVLRDTLMASVVVDDAASGRALRRLRSAAVNAGETSAAGLAGLWVLSEVLLENEPARRRLGWNANGRVLLFNTEGEQGGTA